MSKAIKFLVMDVDGTLTDGKIYIGVNGEIMKSFNIKDGYGIHDMLPQLGITPVIITGRKSQIVENRCLELGIVDFFQGVSDKKTQLEMYLESVNGLLSQVAYVGDDLNDLPCMVWVREFGGFVAVPFDSCEELKIHADLITNSNGGEGAVREVIDYLFYKGREITQ